MSTQIDSLSIRIESTSKDASAAIDQLTKSLQQLRTAGNLSGITKSLQKIADAVNGGMKNVPTQFTKSAKAADTFAKSTKNAAASTSQLGSSLSSTVTNLRDFLVNATGIYTLGQALSTALSAAREWDGISARFAEGFGDQVDEAYAHVQRLSEALYINDQVFMQYASNFATLARGFGVTESAIKNMSIGLTELAYDIYAKNNDFYTFTEAMDAVRSAIVGEVEPIRRAGISITEATLKEVAANNGIAMSVENMTEAQKAMLRYKAMVDQAYASSTVGTYIQELNTVEGSSRALGQQLKGLAQTIGSVLMPVVAAVMPYIQAFVALVTRAIAAIGALFGVTVKAPSWSSGMDSLSASAGSATDAVEGTTAALGGAGKAAKKLKDYVMGFDELNIIKPQENTGGSGGGGGGGGIGDLGLDLDSLWTDAMIEAATLKADEIVQRVMTFLQPLKEAIQAIDFQPLVDSAKRLWEALKPFAATVGAGLYWFLLNVLVPLAGYTIENIIPDFLNGLAAALEWVTPQLQQFGQWVEENKENIATVAAMIAAFFVAFKGVSLIAGAVGGFGELANILTAVTGALMGNKAALSALTFMFPKLSGAISTITTALSSGTGLTGLFSSLGASMSGVLVVAAVVVAVVVAIASVALVLAANWDKVVEAFRKFAEYINLSGTFEAIKTAVASFVEKLAGLKDLFMLIGTVVLATLQPALAVIAGIFNGLLSAIAPLIDAIGGVIDILAGLGSFLVGVFTLDMEKAASGLQTIWEGIVAVFVGVFDAILGLVRGFVEGVAGWFGGLLAALGLEAFADGITNFVSTLLGGILGFAQLVRDSIVSAFTTAWENIKAVWSVVVSYFSMWWENIKLVFAVVGDVLSGHFSDAWEKIKQIFANFVQFFSDLWDAVKRRYENAGEFFSGVFSGAWAGIEKAWSGVTRFFGDIRESINDKFQKIGSWMGEKFSAAWTAVKNAFAPFVDYFRQKWETVKSIFSVVKHVLSDYFSAAWTSIKNIFSGWASFFSNLWNTISTTFSALGTKLGDAIGSAVKSGINSILKWVQDTVNKAINLINGAIDIINKVPGVNVDKIKTVSIPMMATGGYVGEGQMFIAREAGPELVGSMNGRTAVANNDQIIEGISQGVYSAVLAAMSQGSNSSTANVNVYLDGKQITAAVEKRQRERGATIMTGGVTFGY